MNNLPIYLDYAAATPLDEAVFEAMIGVLKQDGIFANPSAKDHVYGWMAAEAVEDARAKIGDAVGAKPLNLIFTSGATESNNFAILGLARSKAVKDSGKRHIITSKIEHKSVLSSLKHLEECGFEVTYLSPDSKGEIHVKDVEAAICDSTFLVTICHANSVIGTVNDVHAIASVCKKRGVYFHTDCAQSAGWFSLDLDKSDITLASLTPEKIYGPKGIGALYIKRSEGLELEPLIYGGGQERGLRGGTLATHQIVAMGEAFYQMTQKAEDDALRLQSYKKILLDKLSDLDFVKVNGRMEKSLPTILSLTFQGVEPLMLLPSLNGIAASTGSACSSSNLEPSYVLKAIGLSDNEARASLRISMGRFTTQDQIERAAHMIREQVLKLHANNNMWQVKE